jgi:hypothetical protein
MKSKMMSFSNLIACSRLLAARLPTGTRQSTRLMAPKSCCIPENPRGGREEASFDPLQPHVKNPAQGYQWRLASLRTELLPALSPHRSTCASDRYVYQPSRISMRRQE